jgi:glutathione S-transferase
MVYSVATAEPPVLKVFLNTVRRPEPERNPAEAEAGRTEFREVAALLTRVLETKPFLLGEQFTAADVVVGSIVGWARGLKLVEDFPVLKDYSRRLVERPAYKRATAD